VHGGSGEALTRYGEMDKGRKEEALDPNRMEEDQINHIMATTRRTCSGVPYQYKMKNKKRDIVIREGLESDE
jgi:hypothetical protein